MIQTDDFEAFMRAYQNLVFTTAVRLLGNSVDAQDIAQEVFLKAYDRFNDLRQSPTAGGWLKTVTTNLCLNQLTRYRARWRFFSEMTDAESDEESMESRLPAEDKRDLTEELDEKRHLLETALHKLPQAQRVPLVLYHFEEMSYEAIAAQLKTSLSKVKTDIHRGRLALAKKLGFTMEGTRKD